jgi:hypothetical protein
MVGTGRFEPPTSCSPKHKIKFKNKLYSLDATVISLCLTLFPWASFRRTKAGVKLHTLLDHGGYPYEGWRASSGLPRRPSLP